MQEWLERENLKVRKAARIMQEYTECLQGGFQIVLAIDSQCIKYVGEMLY